MSRPARAAGKGEGVGQRSGQRVERLARGKQKVGNDVVKRGILQCAARGFSAV